MTFRTFCLPLSLSLFPVLSGCNGTYRAAPSGESAVIVGSFATSSPAGRQSSASQFGCPNVVVTLNGAVVPIVLDNDCAFLIDEVRPAPNVVLTIELPDVGVSGTIELDSVGAAELIEILVETGDSSLRLSIVRRAIPDRDDRLPLVITGNNVTIFLPAGTHDQTLTVEGNNFTLVGESGDDCDDRGWTVITGAVVVEKNNATFRNIRFEGSVEILGNNASFINSCVGNGLIIFGNNTEFGDDSDNNRDDDLENDNSDDSEDNDSDPG